VRHLITVPAAALLSLPLGVLVTDTAGVPAGDDHRNIAWLGRRFAMSTLPSVASLKDLRAVSGASAATKPFIGFGDPAFTGAAGDRRSAAATGALCRQGEPLDTELVRTLPRLRETATELRRSAQALGAPADSVVLGNDVTESRVRAATLSDYKVIVFATHGLLPSELKCKAEPALALTPPAAATATEDGLLDASEIAQLRLDADWVVLSACNTAGPDGNLGGESLSGLARAFFSAGARCLLVSHWAVASRATVALTTGMFSAYAKSPTRGRAGALARAQRALQDDKDTSHPFFWAPLVLVGDGGSGPGS
jgi:CHAT domain-containing protein